MVGIGHPLGPLALWLRTPAQPEEGLLCPRSDGRWRGRGTHTWLWLGLWQPLSTQLLKACVEVPGHLEHPVTLSFALSLSLQLSTRGEKQNELIL